MSQRRTPSKRPSYQRAKEEITKSAGRVRIYGIQLERPDDKTILSVWFCGYHTDNTDYRVGSKRILNIPAEAVVQRGEVAGYKYEEWQVEWFDVEARARLVEECFVAFEASSFLDSGRPSSDLTILERIHGAGSPHLLPPAHGRARPEAPPPIPIIVPFDPPNDPMPIIVPPNPTPNPVPIVVPFNPPPNPVPIVVPFDPPNNPIPIIIPLD